MKKIVILGNSKFASLMYWYIKNDTNLNVVAFSSSKEYCTESLFEGLPMIALNDIEKECPPIDHLLLLGIGYTNMNNKRKHIFNLCKNNMGYNFYSYINSSSVVNSKNIGEGCIILENTVIQPFVTIGVANLIWHNISISHDTQIGDFNCFAQATSICGMTTIGNNCYFGSQSVVFNNAKIADYSLIGAGAQVSKNTNPYEVIVPAKSLTLLNKKSVDFI